MVLLLWSFVSLRIPFWSRRIEEVRSYWVWGDGLHLAGVICLGAYQLDWMDEWHGMALVLESGRLWCRRFGCILTGCTSICVAL